MKTLEEILDEGKCNFRKVVPFNEKVDRLLLLDFKGSNTELTQDVFSNTLTFTNHINTKLQSSGAKFGIGGYGEHRTIYSRSNLFGLSPAHPEGKEESAAQNQLGDDGTNIPGTLDSRAGAKFHSHSGEPEGAEPRRLHLGIDIWGKPFTPVIAPLDGFVHSFAFNNSDGDYGATIILSHRLDELNFHTLYGHLSLASIKNLREGARIKAGDTIAEFGIPQENGNWPPHLHFQIIKDLHGKKGDYPGVCQYTKRDAYLHNCPDGDLILDMMKYAK